MTAGPGSRRSTGSLLFTVVLWLIAIGVLVGGLSFRYAANVAPLLLGGAATALLSVIVIEELRRYLRGGERPAPGPGEPAEGETGRNPAGPIQDPAQADAAAARAIEAAVSPIAIGTILPAYDPAAEKNEGSALLWAGATIALLLLLGFVGGVSVAMLGMLRLYGRESWLMSILTTIVVMVTLYVAFGIFLRISFFPGMLPQALGLA